MSEPVVLLSTALTLVLALLGLRTWAAGAATTAELERRTALDVVEAQAGRLSTRLDARLRRTRAGRSLRGRVERAGVDYRVIDVAAALGGICVVAFLLADRFVSWWFALLAAGLLGRLALTWLTRQEVARREEFVAQLPEVARVLSNATSAGLALRSAITLAAGELAEPAAAELRRLSERLALGVALEDALEELEQRLPSRELSLLTRTLIIQSRAGGAVVSALKGMSLTLDSRKDLRRELRTMLSGAVFTSYVVIIIGAGSLLLLNSISPGTLNRMTTSLLGQAALLVAGLLYAVGFLLIRRQTRVEV